MVFDLNLILLALFAMMVFFAVIERPILGVALLIVARLMDVSRNAFFTIGPINVGMFEPCLALAGLALLIWFMREKPREVMAWSWPWRNPFFAFATLMAVSLLWSAKRSEGMGEMFTFVVILANTLILVYFVRTPKQFFFILYAWIAACLAIGVLSELTDAMGVAESTPWKAAAGGGRSTGLGQQPNWYAMNLHFIVHTTFGLALIQEKRARRWLFILSGLVIFFFMMRSGSRGGAYSIMLGGGLAALALPVFRKWFIRFAAVVVVLFTIAILVDLGSVSQAFVRIYSNLDHTWGDVRPQNWTVCVQEFIDTKGLGIGAGGYVTLLMKYNYRLYESVYRYPHGIFWGLISHYGVPGLLLFGWIVARIAVMAREVIRMTRGSSLNIFAWTMPASMLGYAAWSFVEFEWNEKPFWEFLALYTALYLLVKRMVQEGKPLPPLPAGYKAPWERLKELVSRSPRPNPEPAFPLDPRG